MSNYYGSTDTDSRPAICTIYPSLNGIFVELLQYSRVCNYRRFIYHRWFPVGDVTVFRMTAKNESVWRDNRNYSAILATLQITSYVLTRIILRPLSALSLDEVNIAKRNITTGLFGLHAHLQVVYYKCVKFHKNPIRCLGGVALTRYMDGRTDKQMDRVIPIYPPKLCLWGV